MVFVKYKKKGSSGLKSDYFRIEIYFVDLAKSNLSPLKSDYFRIEIQEPRLQDQQGKS